MKDYSKAIEDYEVALKLDSSLHNAAYSKALCENILGRYEDAIETYNLVLAQDIQPSPALRRLPKRAKSTDINEFRRLGSMNDLSSSD